MDSFPEIPSVMEELPNRGHSKHKAKLIQTPRVRHVQIGPEEKMAPEAWEVDS